MAIRDESDHIDAAIDAALAQQYSGDLEVVVAEGASVDQTRSILDERAAVEPRLRVIDNPGGRTATGLNAAIAAASGDVIVRCDGHSELSPDYVSRAVEVLAQTAAANVGGRQAAVGTSFLQRAIAMAMTSPLGVGNSRFHYSGKPGPTDTVYLGVFQRSALDEIGGFDETLIRNQDYELNHRLRKAGHTVWFDPEMAVTYRPRSSLKKLWRQYFDYGAWKRTMLRSSPDALKARQLAPPLLVIGLVASIALFVAGRPTAAIVPGTYLAFTTLGTLVELFRRRDLAAIALPLVLSIMHLAWGLGFTVGEAR